MNALLNIRLPNFAFAKFSAISWITEAFGPSPGLLGRGPSASKEKEVRSRSVPDRTKDANIGAKIITNTILWDSL